jgi:hypothetical protein
MVLCGNYISALGLIIIFSKFTFMFINFLQSFTYKERDTAGAKHAKASEHTRFQKYSMGCALPIYGHLIYYNLGTVTPTYYGNALGLDIVKT